MQGGNRRGGGMNPLGVGCGAGCGTAGGLFFFFVILPILLLLLILGGAVKGCGAMKADYERHQSRWPTHMAPVDMAALPLERETR